jgi:hypothetical protein
MPIQGKSSRLVLLERLVREELANTGTASEHTLVDAATEHVGQLVEDYKLGNCKVPRDWWPIVKLYRELSQEADNSALAMAQCNALDEALRVLVASRGK